MKNDKYILDENGSPVECSDLLTWAKWTEENKEKTRIKQELVNGLFVSTIFLGLDYSFIGIGKPVLYETMVFDEREKDENEHKSKLGKDIFQERYPTKELAIAEHDRIVEDIKAGKDISNY